MEDKYKIEDCLLRLSKTENYKPKLKLLWNWIKQGHINFQEFEKILKTLQRQY